VVKLGCLYKLASIVPLSVLPADTDDELCGCVRGDILVSMLIVPFVIIPADTDG
jgi:hypothetical protein